MNNKVKYGLFKNIGRENHLENMELSADVFGEL
jgi:hypothetical protein